MISGVSLPQNQLSLRPFMDKLAESREVTYDHLIDEMAEQIKAEPEPDKASARVASLGHSIRIDPKDQREIAEGLQKRGISAVHTQQNAIALIAAGIFQSALEKRDFSQLTITPADTSAPQLVEPSTMGLRDDLAVQAYKDSKYDVNEYMAASAEEMKQAPPFDDKQKAEFDKMVQGAGVLRLDDGDVSFIADSLGKQGISEEMQTLAVAGIALQAFQDRVDRAQV
jgi:hypothetical protein